MAKRKPNARAKFIGAYLRKMHLKGAPLAVRIGAFREAARAWRERNPFVPALVDGIGVGAGFATGSRIMNRIFKNPVTGELVQVKHDEKAARVIGEEGGGLFGGKKYWVLMPDGSRALVPGRALKSLNPVPRTWSGSGEVPWSVAARSYPSMWTPNPGKQKYARCPVHGNYIRLRKGTHTATCPIGGEKLGIRWR